MRFKSTGFLLAFAAACRIACAADEPDPSRKIRSDMRRAFDWQIAHPTTHPVAAGQSPNRGDSLRGWVHGAFLTGVMEAYRTTKDPAYLDYAWKSAEQSEWQPGPRPTNADDHIPIASAPGEFTADSSQEYGTGAFLLAGSELLKLLERQPLLPPNPDNEAILPP